MRDKKYISIIFGIFLISSCSTNQGWYDKNDPSNNEFSVVNTVLSVGAAAAVVIGAHELADNKNNFAGGDSYAWDYQPGNNSWVCRNRRNGQYSYNYNCSGPKIDHWQ